MSVQLSLFSMHERTPTWDDVQKGRASFVPHAKYSTKCVNACMWFDSKFEKMGEITCYLFDQPIRGGMCPGTGRIEWNGES